MIAGMLVVMVWTDKGKAEDMGHFHLWYTRTLSFMAYKWLIGSANLA